MAKIEITIGKERQDLLDTLKEVKEARKLKSLGDAAFEMFKLGIVRYRTLHNYNVKVKAVGQFKRGEIDTPPEFHSKKPRFDEALAAAQAARDSAQVEEPATEENTEPAQEAAEPAAEEKPKKRGPGRPRKNPKPDDMLG